MLVTMKEELVLPEGVKMISAEVGERPVFADGLPRFGFLPEIGNLFIAVGHPGVILAPLIGRLADLLARIADTPISKQEQLLPWNGQPHGLNAQAA